MFGLLYSFGYFSDFLVSNSWKLGQLYLDFTIAEFVDVSHVFYNLIFHQQINDTFSHALDIHAILAHEMLDLLFGFFRTMRIGAVIMHIFLCD